MLLDKDSIQAVGQHANCTQVIVQRCPVCLDVDSIGKSADNLNFIAAFGYLEDEFIDNLPSIFSGISCANDADDFGAIQIGFPF